jgi:hypothetical protein
MVRASFLLAILLMASGCGQRPEESVTPASPKVSDEAAAVAMLKLINQAQQDFIRRTRRYALTFDELVEARLLSARPDPLTTGYNVRLRPSPDAVSYTVIATPANPGPSARHLFSDNTGKVRAEADHEASAASPEV